MPARKTIGLVLAGAGFVLSAKGAYLQVKAQLAQVLLARAWEERREGEAEPRPWPWADTWPVALLRVPRLEKELIVLSGVSGRNMAFGPTYLESSALPGTEGNTVVVGHRDSHFELLRHLAPGDEIWVETPDAVRHRYLVAGAEILDEHDSWVTAPLDEKTLTLVTCYPFDAVVPGGPGRYVVWALGK